MQLRAVPQVNAFDAVAPVQSAPEFVAEEDVYRTLYEPVLRLVLPIRLQPALNDIMASAISVVGADAGYIRLFGLDDSEAQQSPYPFAASQGISEAYLEYFGSLPKPVDRESRRAVFEGKRVVVEDMFTSPAFAAHRRVVLAEGLRSMQATPMMSVALSRCIGVIVTCFYNVHTPPADRLELLDIYAELAAAAIERKLMVQRRDERDARIQAVAQRQSESLLSVQNRAREIENGAYWTAPDELQRQVHNLIGDLDTVLGELHELIPQLDREDLDEVESTESYSLSSRELHVLKLIWDGLSDKQIATAIGISRYTVYKHVGSILRKMDVESRTQASIRAEREGLFKAFTESAVAIDVPDSRHHGRVHAIAGRGARSNLR